jgi:hypothetical protein
VKRLDLPPPLMTSVLVSSPGGDGRKRKEILCEISGKCSGETGIEFGVTVRMDDKAVQGCSYDQRRLFKRSMDYDQGLKRAKAYVSRFARRSRAKVYNNGRPHGISTPFIRHLRICIGLQLERHLTYIAYK